MHDFDEARRARDERDRDERTFKAGGVEFVHRLAVPPETTLRWTQAITEEITLTEAEWLGVLDETIVAILEPGQKEAWDRVRSADVEHPLTIADLREILRWLLSRVTGRPTGEESGSSSNGSPSATTSKAGSSSPEAALAT